MLLTFREGLLLVLLLVFVLIQSSSPTLQCLSDTGNPVDWWVTVKYPNSRSYSYTDSTISGNALAESKYNYYTGSQSSLNFTLSPLYGKTSGLSYIMFNDEPPNSSLSLFQSPLVETAHAKGIIAVDDYGDGYWLLHSVPIFPLSPAESTTFQYMLDGETEYAQNLFCVTFDSWSVFNTIGYQLQFYKPDIYGYSFTSIAETNAPNLYDALTKYIHVANYSIPTIKSKGGLSIRSFAKTSYYGYGYDLYDELISPKLKEAIDAQTWRQGSGDPLPSNCTETYHVMNIDDVDINGHSWNYLNDHSKWAVSSSSGSDWVCMCDMNRMASQGERGGGALCFENTGLHNSLLGDVTDVESC